MKYTILSLLRLLPRKKLKTVTLPPQLTFTNVPFSSFDYLFDGFQNIFDEDSVPVYGPKAKHVIGELKGRGNIESAFGVTKTRGGSMYHQAEIVKCTVMYKPTGGGGDGKMKLIYETDDDF